MKTQHVVGCAEVLVHVIIYYQYMYCVCVLMKV